MTDPTTQALESLLTELTGRGSPLADFLEPGLPAEEVEVRLNELGAEPHPDVVRLYVWHNGFNRFRVPVSSNGMLSLVPGHPEFNALEEVAEVYRGWRNIAEREGPHTSPRHQWSVEDHRSRRRMVALLVPDF